MIPRDVMAKLASEGCDCSQLANFLDEGQIDGYMLKPMVSTPCENLRFSSEIISRFTASFRRVWYGIQVGANKREISGMTRVRGFTQDDAHLFVTEDQIAEEIQGCIELVQIIFSNLGMKGL